MLYAQLFIITEVAFYRVVCVNMFMHFHLFLNSVIYVGNGIIYVFSFMSKGQFFAHWYLSPYSDFYLGATFLMSSRYCL